MVMATGCGPASTDTSSETISARLQTPLIDATQNELGQTTKTHDVSAPVATPEPEQEQEQDKNIITQKDSVKVENTLTELSENNSTEPLIQNDEIAENTNQNQVNPSINPASTATPEADAIAQRLPEDTNSDSSMTVFPTEPVVMQPTPATPSKPSWPEAPDFSLPSAQGNQVALSSHEGDKHTILVFYRAYW
jgi:hypothetical protein